MNIRVDRHYSQPLYLQIRDQIRMKIWNGSLLPGSKLPPERKLAKMLGVNRTTILNAYQELKADGLIDAVVGSGTIVQERTKWKRDETPNQHTKIEWMMASLLRGAPETTIIQDLLRFPSAADHISFAVGKVPAECIPVERFRQLQTDLIDELGDFVFQHGLTQGYHPLRQSICHLMNRRGIKHCSEEEVIVVSGAQQGLDLVARTLIESGDIVLVEEPTYFSAVQLFRLYGARIMTIPSDHEGKLHLDFLESMLLRYHPKFIYIQPTFQNPTGRVLTLEERKSLLELAERHQTIIVEEDPYFELRYEGEHVPPIKAFDQSNLVIYVGTFSKLLYPGMRVGWVYASSEVIAAMTRWKQFMDLHSNHAAQILTDRYMRLGFLEQHLVKCRKHYVGKRDLMTKSISIHPELELQFHIPEGGYFMWLPLPQRISSTVLLMHALQENVSFLPGSYFSFDARGTAVPHIRLNFTYPSQLQIEEGISKLMKLIKHMLNNHNHQKENCSSMPLV